MGFGPHPGAATWLDGPVVNARSLSRFHGQSNP
jgi:hypothetical protein